MPEHTVFSRQSARSSRPSIARWVMLTGLFAMSAACGSSDESAAPLDAELTRDLSMASEASSTVPIAFGDTATGSPAPTPTLAPEQPPVAERAPEPAPRAAPRPTPRPTPAPVAAAATPEPEPAAPIVEPTPAPTPAPAPSRRTILSAGTELLGATGTRVCSNTNRPGDRVVMRLTSDVTGPDGARLIAGTAVLLELASASDSGLVFRVKGVSVEGQIEPVVATASVESDLEGSRVSGGDDKKKVIGGAIAGAILGGILGRDTKGAVIGAAGGAAAGTIAARRGGTTEQCLAAGSTVRVVLKESLVITRSGA